ncbi:MAG: CGLD27 family protein [Oscillatoria sp. PMC 1051.18]|nr:CGLD27 family protein [Oscillatoria sp. PMC 1050.18]MEC5028617.1 CGLD27 family protein [Oscillatoria sp. PMC 1051.18]
MKQSFVSVCPVPSEQQPLNEYEQLKDSWFYSWAKLDLLAYWRKLAWVWLWGWIVAGPIAAASFTPEKDPLKFALCGAAGAGALVTLIVLRLYLGWRYIRDRLHTETVFYEESGWYDGQSWQKPTEVLERDRLIVSYQVQPVLLRLEQTFAIFTLLIVSGSLLWLL